MAENELVLGKFEARLDPLYPKLDRCHGPLLAQSIVLHGDEVGPNVDELILDVLHVGLQDGDVSLKLSQDV